MTKTFTTENSVYVIEVDRYMRLPKNEAPRSGDWSWRLADAVWHPLREWAIEPCPYDESLNRLHLWTPDAVHGVTTSPIVEPW